jgi:hypothetical protein
MHWHLCGKMRLLSWKAYDRGFVAAIPSSCASGDMRNHRHDRNRLGADTEKLGAQATKGKRSRFLKKRDASAAIAICGLVVQKPELGSNCHQT